MTTRMSYSRRAFLAAVGATAAGTAAATEVRADGWTLPRGDHRNSGHAPVDGPGGALGVDWRHRSEGALTAYPVPFDGRGYVGYEDGRVLGIDTTTGSTDVLARLDATPTLALTASAETVFVPTREGAVHAIDRDAGRRRWREPVEGSVESPLTVRDDTLVFGTADGRVVSLSAADGSRRWSQSLSGPVRTVPAVTADAVVVRDADGHVAALDRVTGDVRWRRSFAPGPSPGAFKGPAVRDGRVYVESAAGERERRLAALAPDTGDRIWARDVEGGVLQLLSRPDRVIAFHGDSVHAHDPADGSVVWRTGRTERVLLASASDAVYAVSEDVVAVLDPGDGTERDRFDPDGRLVDAVPDAGRSVRLVGSPIPIDGGVLLIDADGGLWGLRGGVGTDLAELGVGAGLLGVGGYLAYRFTRTESIPGAD